MLWTPWTSSVPTPPPPGIRSPPVPCNALDLVNFPLILTTGVIVDSRLDARKLEDTIMMLVERKFPRVGARIALRNGVSLTFHSFGDMPAVKFTAEDQVEAYRSDASRPQLPMDMPRLSASSPTISKVPDLDAYFQSPGPKTIQDWIESKSPLLHIHVSVFDDLTFIGVTSPHVGFDAVGTGILLDAWTRLINGVDLGNSVRRMQRAELLGTPRVPIHPGDVSKRSTIGLPAIHRVNTWRLDQSKINTIRYSITVPKVFLASWKRQIMDELQRQGSAEWVGSSDVLLAWWHKETLGHRANDETPMHLVVVVNLRNKPIFYASEFDSIGEYIGNAVSIIPVPPFPTRTFNEESIGQLALHLRRAINAYNADPSGIRDGLHYMFTNPDAFLLPYPAAGTQWTLSTNWRMARFGALNFSGAQIQLGGQTKKTDVSFVYPIMTAGRKRLPMREWYMVLMEDEEVVWVMQASGAKNWENIRRRTDFCSFEL
ncbi:hypothetical protein FB45DRAFT_742574 [Roridomyces roridus]|uniref:Uncharacterized protein n=1 Tax=Roridomyces roridus TaxID=1738132 RepID=A0AAD7FPW4_9AGAR|nr:hypothetical protein FB45DRAFT_742574 [Roridomyces roridus]